MRSKLKMLGLSAVAALSAVAFSSGVSAAPCATGVSFSVWLTTAGFNCSVGALTFSNFIASGVNANPGSLLVGPATTTDGPGLKFSNFASPGAGNNNDYRIRFNITSTVPLLQAFLSATDGLPINGNPAITWTDTENTGVVPNISIGNGDSSPRTLTNSSANFPAGVMSILVDEDISQIGATQLMSIDKEFRVPTITTPEPASLALLASGLLGLGWLGRRRNKNS